MNDIKTRTVERASRPIWWQTDFPANITDDIIDETKRNSSFIQVNMILSQLIPVFYVN